MVFGYFYYLISVGYWLLGWLVPARRESAGAPLRAAASPLLLAGLGVVLSLSFGLELTTISRAARRQDFLAALPPLPLVALNTYIADWAGETILLLTAVQSVALAALYRELRGRTIGRAAGAALAATALVLPGAAFATRTTTSFDIYLYAGLAHLGGAAYAPPRLAFPGEFAAINALWGTPLYPSAYGPVWVWLSSAVVGLGATLPAQLDVFRLLGALAFALCLALLAGLRVERATLALFALNPALVEQFVANGHNDLVPLAFTLGALLAMRRGHFVPAILLAAAAGATKLPFALIATLAFAGVPDLRRRLVAAFASVALALGLTVAGSNGRYFSAAAAIAHSTFRHPVDLATKLSYGLAVAAALAGLALALFRRRLNPLGAWPIATLSVVLYPWYLAWCLPYALVEETFFPQFLIALPLVAFFLTNAYSHVPLVRAAYALVALAPLAVLFALRRRSRLERTGPSRKS